MKLKLWLGGFALGLSVVSQASAATRCSVPGFATFDGQTAPGHMYIASGRPCSVTLGFSAGPIHSVTILQKPRNGRVVQSGSNRLVYASRPGFVGEDTFTYERRGFNRTNVPIVLTVNMTVHVSAD